MKDLFDSYILIIDDDVSWIKSISICLESPLQSCSVKDERAAISILVKAKVLPRLVVMNYDLPQFKGNEFIKFKEAVTLIDEIPMIIYSEKSAIASEYPQYCHFQRVFCIEKFIAKIHSYCT